MSLFACFRRPLCYERIDGGGGRETGTYLQNINPSLAAGPLKHTLLVAYPTASLPYLLPPRIVLLVKVVMGPVQRTHLLRLPCIHDWPSDPVLNTNIFVSRTLF